MHVQTFELVVHSNFHGTHTVTSPPSAVSTFAVQLSEESLYALSYKMAGNRRLTRARYYTADDHKLAKEVGDALFRSLIDGQIKSAYRDRVESASDDDTVLRVVLNLTEAPTLLTYPWELLYDTLDGSYIVAATNTTFIRLFAVSRPMRPKAVAPPLRVLVVSANPKGLPPLHTEEDVTDLQNAEKTGLAALIAMEHISNPTIGELKRRLDSLPIGSYDILHFIGHGRFSGDAKIGTLSFRGDRDQIDNVSPDRFAAVVRNRGIPLAIINACEGGRTDSGDPSAGVALNLLRARFAAVVAMQFEITDSAAVSFSRNLYEALARGTPIDVAVSRARAQIFTDHETLEWAAPVLYLSAADATVFDLVAKLGGSEAQRRTKEAAEEQRRTKEAAEEQQRRIKEAAEELTAEASERELEQSMDPSAKTRIDCVAFSVFAPEVVQPRTSFVLSVWASLADSDHPSDPNAPRPKKQREEMLRRASAGGQLIEAGRRAPVRIPGSSDLALAVELDGFVIPEPVDVLAWEGEISNVSFIVHVPEIAPGSYPGTVRVKRSGLLLARIIFEITVGRGAVVPHLVQLGRAQRNIGSAFASYASADREAVLGRVQGIRATGIDVFVDVLTLRAAEDWETELRRAIQERDILYLFWSRAARASTWVEREWRMGLDEKGIDFIWPVPLIDPRDAPPPPELSTRHFYDDILPHIEVERHRHADLAPPPCPAPRPPALQQWSPPSYVPIEREEEQRRIQEAAEEQRHIKEAADSRLTLDQLRDLLRKTTDKAEEERIMDDLREREAQRLIKIIDDPNKPKSESVSVSLSARRVFGIPLPQILQRVSLFRSIFIKNKQRRAAAAEAVVSSKEELGRVEPVTTVIVAALSAGGIFVLQETATVVVKETATVAARDAYTGLKSWIHSHYRGVSIEQLETQPASKALQVLVGEGLERAGASRDKELLKLAQTVIDLIHKQAPDVAGSVDLGALDLGANDLTKSVEERTRELEELAEKQAGTAAISKVFKKHLDLIDDLRRNYPLDNVDLSCRNIRSKGNVVADVRAEVSALHDNIRIIIEEVASTIENRRYELPEDKINNMPLSFNERSRAISLLDADKRRLVSHQSLNIAIEVFCELNKLIKEQIEQSVKRGDIRGETHMLFSNAILVFELTDFIIEYIEKFKIQGVDEIRRLYAEAQTQIATNLSDLEDLKRMAQGEGVAEGITKATLSDVADREKAIQITIAEWEHYMQGIKAQQGRGSASGNLPTLRVMRANAQNQLNVLEAVAVLQIAEDSLVTLQDTLKTLETIDLVSLDPDRVTRLIRYGQAKPLPPVST